MDEDERAQSISETGSVTEEEFRVGIKLRVFNYNLHRALEATGKTRLQASAELGIPLEQLYRYLSFKAYPNVETQLKIAVYVNLPLDSIFPEYLSDVRLVRQPPALSFTRDEALALGIVASDRDGGAKALEEVEERVTLEQTLPAVLAKACNPRELKAVDLRFGLTSGEEMSLRDVGREMGVTRVRVDQILAKVFRKLRHPRYSRVLCTMGVISPASSLHGSVAVLLEDAYERIQRLVSSNWVIGVTDVVDVDHTRYRYSLQQGQKTVRGGIHTSLQRALVQASQHTRVVTVYRGYQGKGHQFTVYRLSGVRWEKDEGLSWRLEWEEVRLGVSAGPLPKAGGP